VASRAAKIECDKGHGIVPTGLGVYLDFSSAIERYGKSKAHTLNLENPSAEKIYELGKAVVEEKYGNLFEMYEKITGENPYEMPMKIYPAVHYTMGGLWVDYNLETNIPGLFALGECNFSDHGANRLGAKRNTHPQVQHTTA
jgi:succinate dehydrogenase / fumarate reductase flavoprotein subunit